MSISRNNAQQYKCQAQSQRGSSCSYTTAMECKVITGMSLYRIFNLNIAVFMSALVLFTK